MQISAYCQKKRCPEQEWFGETLKKKSRPLVFGSALRNACESLVAGTQYKDVLNDTYSFLLEEYGTIEGYYEWQAERYAQDDVRKLRRFLVFVGKVRFIAANVATSFREGELFLEGKASLIFEKDDKTYFVILRPGRCDRSIGGKVLATKISGDLRLLVAKYSLEEAYPGIVPWCVYMTHPDDADGEIVKDFSFTNTKATNLTVLPVGGYYKDGTFLRNKIAQDIIAAANIPEERNCDMCDYACLCKAGESVPGIGEEENLEPVKKRYVLPKFTKQQQEVIDHMDGPLLVCAGAGSGKTATLVGRVVNLVRHGISPANILCLTFGRSAASELADRCQDLLMSDQACQKGRQKKPKITTIHALSMDFLRGYGAEILGSSPKVLEDMTKQKIIEELLSERDRIPGFKYEKKDGVYGLLRMVLRRMDELKSIGSDAFRSKHPEIGDGFYEVAKAYEDRILAENYIEFDQMVPLAIRLMRENDGILSLMQLSYQYVMVDEFQDVSTDQAEFVYLLASAHKNLVVVGDDDQCIYRWRGAMPGYMRDFPALFSARTVIFPDNFRSTDGIVKTAQALIGRNPGRIEKHVVSSSGRVGIPPQIVHSTSPADIRRVITEVTGLGYSYGQIAIIGRTNKVLSDLKETLGVPCILARKFLRQDPFFGLVRAALTLYDDEADGMAFALLATPFGLQREATLLAASGNALERARKEERFGMPVALLDELFESIRSGSSPSDFIKKCAVRTFWDVSDAPTVMTEEFMLSHPDGGTLPDLKEWCREVVEYGSEKRVNERAVNAVTLITNHDCKGLEYPVVLLVSEYSEKSPEERSLFYVGITRAQERLYLFESSLAKASFLDELGDGTKGP